ncbi:hypothetical protein AB0F88_42715 [Streptosporangium sp. NPDC023963]|uniref:hypothetical protein n=1 Tax=Streptosporangium sp. NPDC023963 TaxID=3155608 RepID=UPI0034467993
MSRKKRRGEAPAELPRFGILVAKGVDAVVRDAGTPRRVREAFVRVHEEVARRGCAAAHYRLSGPGNWPRFCVIRLSDGWRLVVSFPEVDTVLFLLLERHDNRTDPYAFLEEAFDLPGRAGHRAETAHAKPSCCGDDSGPPLTEDQGLMAAIEQIARRRV